MEEVNKTIETINTDSEGNERCINAHYHCSNEESFVSKPKDGYGYVRTGVVEQVFLNGSSEGVASTLTTGHDRAKNITDPNGGHKQMGVLEVEYRGKTYKDGEGLSLFDSESFQKKGLEGVSRTLRSSKNDAAVVVRRRIRKLTERECFRLMGVDDKDIDTIQQSGVSKTQQYKMAGNSIVVDVLYHIFRKMFVETQNESRQLTLF